jgi:GntR family transcriptional regulator
VSSITTRQAVLNLVQEGLLTRKQGKGTFVNEGVMDIKNIMTFNLKGDLNAVVPEGLTGQKVNCLDIVRVKTPKKIAKIFEMEAGEEIVRIRRTRSVKGVVISYVKNYLPLAIGEKIKKKDLLRFPMLQILKNHLGIPVRKGIQYIEAVVADYDVASVLSVSISSPVLYLETLIFAASDIPAEFVQTFYRSDQFKYTLTFDLDESKE